MSKARNIADLGSNDVLDTDANGVTVAGNVTLGDNDKAIFGAGSDLQIWHNGTQSLIEDVGTGGLFLRGDGTVWIQNQAGTENKAEFVSNGKVGLYYDSAEKLATTATGVDVTGTVRADDTIYLESSTGYANIEMGGPSGAYIDLKAPYSDDYDGRLQFDNANNKLILETAGGTSAPVEIRQDGSVKLTTLSSGAQVNGNLVVYGTGNSFNTAPSENGLQLYYETDAGYASIGSYSSGGTTSLDFYTNTGGAAATRKMRIMYDGRILIGEPVGATNRKMTIREDATDGSMRGMKVQNWGGSNAISGVMLQSYDWVQGGVWHGRNLSPDPKNRRGALVLGTNPNTSDLTEEGLIGRLTINNAGNVTTPYQPSWAVYANSNWGWSNGAALPFNAVRWNTGGVSYNTSTYTITIPTTGKYVVGIRGLPSTNFGQFFWQLYVNGVWRSYMFVTDGLSTYEEARGTQVEDFVAGDTIQVRGTGNHSGFYGGYGDTSFYGYLLG